MIKTTCKSYRREDPSWMEFRNKHKIFWAETLILKNNSLPAYSCKLQKTILSFISLLKKLQLMYQLHEQPFFSLDHTRHFWHVANKERRTRAPSEHNITPFLRMPENALILRWRGWEVQVQIFSALLLKLFGGKQMKRFHTSQAVKTIWIAWQFISKWATCRKNVKKN